MKHMKKLAGLALALVMLIALAVPALAAPTELSMGVADTETGHTLTAYQIFTADVKDAGTDTTSGSLDQETIEWGTGVNPAAFLRVLKSQVDESDPRFAGIAEIDEENPDAAAVAKILYLFNPDNSDVAKAFAQALRDENVLTGSGVLLPNRADSGYYVILDTIGENTTAMLHQLTRGVQIAVKTDKPKVQKKVWNEKTEEWEDAAVYALGDEVRFQLSTNVAANYTREGKIEYDIIFHDNMAAGLELKSDSIKVYHNGTEITADRRLWETITNPTHEDEKECTFEVSVHIFNNENVKAGDAITVEYTATVTDTAAIGATGNLNTVWLVTPDEVTEEDTVKVFTFEFDVNKVNGNDEPLNGAGFTLYKWVPNADGTPEAETDIIYNNVRGHWDVVGTDGPADDKSSFKFERLKDGFYRLEESEVPEGYNKAEDSYFIIESATSNDPNPGLTELKAHWTDVTGASVSGDLAEITGNVSAGTVTTKVVNNTGLTLPSTGGIGTTIFYVVGGVLIAAAAILLITKRRMSMNED